MHYTICLLSGSVHCIHLHLYVHATMSNLLSSNNKSIALCLANSTLCDSIVEQCVRALIDMPCLFLNIFHIIILCRMSSLRKSPTLMILYINLAVADGMNGLFLFIRGNCHLLETLYQQPPVVLAITSVVFDIPAGMKYYLITITSVERYISICRPMHSQLLCKNFGKLITAIWLIIPLAHIAISIPLADKVCFMANSGPTLIFGLTNLFTPVAGCLTTSLILTTTFFTVLVLLELHRMMERVCPCLMAHRDMEVMKATKFLIINMITMVLCLVPLSASVFLWYFCQDWKEIIAGPILTAIALLVVCHGIFDTILFGWMMPSFRKEIKQFCIDMKNFVMLRACRKS